MIIFPKGLTNIGRSSFEGCINLNKIENIDPVIIYQSAFARCSRLEKIDLQNVSVVSLKSELSIAILNAGSKQGVHPGMPFAIFRQDRAIGRAMAIDVRPNICGAVIQDVMSQNEPVKVGDVGKVEATKS